ncbi:MAG: PilW family protein, partial [Xanthomonadales bacterium]|nr:PilW family protein [Xanthomonadales bacterium]
NGRFAVSQMSDSLRMASASFCSGSGGNASRATPDSVYVDGLRAPVIAATKFTLPDNTTAFGSTSGDNTYPAEPTSANYPLPSFFYMRGYDCAKDGTCTPVDPHDTVASIPASGTSVGKRVIGSDVLTIRYLDGSQGWAISDNDTVNVTDSAVSSIVIVPETGEPTAADLSTGDLMMYGDCSSTTVFNATFSTGAPLTVTVGDTGTAAGDNLGTFAANLDPDAPTKLYDFSKAFQTITWYLQVVDDGSGDGHVTGALMRRVNGGAAEEIVRGIERLDFKYGVLDDTGATRYLSAEDIDNGDSGAVKCPLQPPHAPDVAGFQTGCLWRAVQTVEVSMLVDGQQSMPTLEDSALAYSYSPDSLAPKPPDDASHVIKFSDQGFQRGVLRREFNALVAVRNFNP